ncbi:hypothetical protein GVAV_000842 [Gurleya vavrai]
MIDFENNFICADVDKIYFEEKEIFNKVEITDLKILENKIYFSDVEGYLNMIDMRKFETLKREKIHEDALNAFEFINENVVSVSLDENIIWSSIKDFKFEKKQKTQGENYSIKYNQNSQTCLYGGSEENLKILI